MNKLFILFFSLVISNTLNLNLNSTLEFDGEKIIDRNLNDSEVFFPSQNFSGHLPPHPRPDRPEIAKAAGE